MSCLLVLATFAVLIHGMVVWKDTPPRITARTGEVYEDGGQIWVPVVVANEGDHPALNVEIEVISTAATGESKATFTLEQIPRSTERRGVVSFQGNRAEQQFRVRVSGFQTDD